MDTASPDVIKTGEDNKGKSIKDLNAYLNQYNNGDDFVNINKDKDNDVNNVVPIKKIGGSISLSDNGSKLE